MNDELSPREHADMRDLVMAGAQRIRPVGKHRMQIVAGATAFVLIAGIAGGAVATASLLGADAEPAPAETSTASPTLTPTPRPTPAPTSSTTEPPIAVESSLGVMPYDGQCVNVLTDSEAGTAAGRSMTRSDFRWQTGSHAVAGGIDCVWVSSDDYLAATLHVYAYPDDLVPADVRAVTGTGCERTADGSRVICDVSGVQDGVWLLVRTTGASDTVSAAGVHEAYDAASRRLADFPPPKRADATPAWWDAIDCDGVASRLDPSALGFERVTKSDHEAYDPVSTPHPNQIASRISGESACGLSFTTGSSPEYADAAGVAISTVPGGAVTFHTVEQAEHGQPIEVSGAASAMWVSGLDRYEGSWNILAVSDGVNVLMLSAGQEDALPLLVSVAESMLDMLG